MDSRVRFSKRQIRLAIEGLLSEKPFDRIQLTEVCARASVNRSTFYRYYDGIADWQRQLVRTFVDMDKDLVGSCTDRSLTGRLCFFYRFLAENHSLFMLLLTPEQRMQSMDTLFADVFFREQMEQDRWFLYGGILNVCRRNLLREQPAPIEDWLPELTGLVMKAAE